MRNAVFLSLVVILPCVPASARDHHHHLRVVPAVYDPDHTGAIISRWVPFTGPDDVDPAIIMAKILPTSANAAAVATVEGLRPGPIDELGFDVFDGGHCDNGSPRLNVTTTDGRIFFFGCSYGVHTAAPDKPATFKRVRFAGSDGVPQLPGGGAFVFGVTPVASIAVVFDDGTDIGSGFTAIDDVDVDGEIVERPSGPDDERVRETLERPAARR